MTNNVSNINVAVNNTDTQKEISVDTEGKFDIGQAYGITSARLASGVESASLDEWTHAAGLDFDIHSVKECYQHKGELVRGTDNILVRSDNSMKLGNVTDRYKIVQPKEVMGFFSDLIDHYGFQMKQAGYADSGKKVYAYASCGGEWEVNAGDRTLNHILLMSSSDGSTATVVQPFVESFICMNQLPAAERLFKPVKVRHSKTFDPREVKFDLGIYSDAMGIMQEDITRMSKKTVSNREALSIIASMLMKKDNIEEESTRNLNRMMEIFKLYNGVGMGSQMEGRKDTLWGVVNAFTEFVDHHQGHSANSRWKAKTSGQGMHLKQNVFSIVNDIAKNDRDIKIIDVAA